MYAKALLLYANLAARFVSECPCQDASASEKIIEAKKNVHEAHGILRLSNHPTGMTGNAYRVRGGY